MSEGSHNAAPNAVGYLHQVRWALVELLRAGPERPDSAISLELYDDVAWDQAGTPTEMLQVKHHQGTSRSLTDRATDVWKTLQVWMDTASPGDPDGPSLVLVTTQVAAQGSAMAALRATERNESSALSTLEEIASEAGAKDTRSTRRQFLALSPTERRTLLHRIRVADGMPQAQDVDDAVRVCLQWTLPQGKDALFLAMVWHWWDSQALAMLQRRIDRIDVGAAQASITDIRNQFTSETLPTFVGLRDVDENEVRDRYQNQPFVQQMQWVAYPPRNLQKAIVDYYRAYTHSVRWLEEDLIGAGELERFEDELKDEWEREFEWMLDTLDEDADESDKQEAGKAMLRRLLSQTGITVRSRYNEPFFARGQRHILADDGQIGWHADFKNRIEDLLHIHI
ncbi:ABC-three component system protein [Nocardia sp. NPDC004582]